MRVPVFSKLVVKRRLLLRSEKCLVDRKLWIWWYGEKDSDTKEAINRPALDTVDNIAAKFKDASEKTG